MPSSVRSRTHWDTVRLHLVLNTAYHVRCQLVTSSLTSHSFIGALSCTSGAVRTLASEGFRASVALLWCLSGALSVLYGAALKPRPEPGRPGLYNPRSYGVVTAPLPYMCSMAARGGWCSVPSRAAPASARELALRLRGHRSPKEASQVARLDDPRPAALLSAS